VGLQVGETPPRAWGRHWY